MLGKSNNSRALGSETWAEPVHGHGRSWVSSYFTSLILFYSIFFYATVLGIEPIASHVRPNYSGREEEMSSKV